MGIQSTGYISLNMSELPAKDDSAPYPRKMDLMKPSFYLDEPELLAELKTLQKSKFKPDDFHLKLDFPQGEAISLQRLQDEYDRAARQEKSFSDSGEKLTIKRYKLQILKAIKKHLRETVLEQPAEPPREQPSFLGYWFTRIAFYLLLVSGLTMDGIGAFLGVQELLSLVSFFSSAVTLAIGIAFCVINSALFYSFEAGMLKKALGIDFIDNASLHIEIDEEQLEVTREINAMLINNCQPKLDKQAYSTYAYLAASFNKDVSIKKKQIVAPTEGGVQSFVRHTITGIGAIMMVASGYFMATSLITFLSAALLGTPMGWLICGIGMVSVLAYFLSMRGEAIVHVFNPAIQKFHDLKTKINSFEEKTKYDFEMNYEIKQNKYKNLSDNLKAKIAANLTPKPAPKEEGMNVETDFNQSKEGVENLEGEVDPDKSEIPLAQQIKNPKLMYEASQSLFRAANPHDEDEPDLPSFLIDSAMQPASEGQAHSPSH